MPRTVKDRRSGIPRRATDVATGPAVLDRLHGLERVMRWGRVVHMLGALVTGTLFLGAPSAGPTFSLMSRVPGWPYILAVPLMAAAALALVLHVSDRRPVSILIPMRVIAAWYLVMAFSFGVVWVAWALAMASEEPSFTGWHIAASVAAVTVIATWQVRVVMDSPPPPRWPLNLAAACSAAWLFYAYQVATDTPLVAAPAVYPVGVYGTLGFLLLLHLSALEQLGPVDGD